MDDLPEVRLIRADGHASRGETKFAGKPTFIWEEVQEQCCEQPMALLGQFDQLDFPEVVLPCRMIVYVFICRTCGALSLSSNVSR